MEMGFWKKRYETDLKKNELPLMKKTCRDKNGAVDCAVEACFYTELAESLSRQPEHVQKVVASRWFCHNNPEKACLGIANYLAEKDFPW